MLLDIQSDPMHTSNRHPIKRLIYSNCIYDVGDMRWGRCPNPIVDQVRTYARLGLIHSRSHNIAEPFLYNALSGYLTVLNIEDGIYPRSILMEAAIICTCTSVQVADKYVRCLIAFR